MSTAEVHPALAAKQAQNPKKEEPKETFEERRQREDEERQELLATMTVEEATDAAMAGEITPDEYDQVVASQGMVAETNFTGDAFEGNKTVKGERVPNGQVMTGVRVTRAGSNARGAWLSDDACKYILQDIQPQQRNEALTKLARALFQAQGKARVLKKEIKDRNEAQAKE